MSRLNQLALLRRRDTAALSTAVRPAENLNLAVREETLPIQVQSREITVGGERFVADPHQLIRMVRRVTQNIGEYRGQNDMYAKIIVTALRKARGDLVTILENEFGIHWKIDPNSGFSTFYLVGARR